MKKELLESRRKLLLERNKQLLAFGEVGKYSRNAQRIAKIAEELNRRELLRLEKKHR